MLLMIFIRGILAPNCFWYGITDRLISDGSGVNLYYTIKEKYKKKIVPTNMLGQTINVVIDNGFIRQILDNSPDTFAVGKFKFKIFKSFMEYNVGVSEGCPWKQRRLLNEAVLASDQLHPYAGIFNNHIVRLTAEQGAPMHFKQFSDFGLKTAAAIVFNDTYLKPFKIFGEANSLKALLLGQHPITPETDHDYHQYLLTQIINPKPYSLTAMGKRDLAAIEGRCPAGEMQDGTTELLHQIPHWMFPISGLITVSAPRVLALLLNHPVVLHKLIMELQPLGREPTAQQIHGTHYLRNCILETFRLNNPVVTTYRTLRKPYELKKGYSYKTGDQFLILNNPVLRDPEAFPEPNRYRPGRWNQALEQSYYAIMFNQGPQRCPGKELAIFVLKSFIINWLNAFGIVQTGQVNVKTKKLDVTGLPQMLNPCNISFTLSH